MVAGIAERRRAAELEQQAERVGEAAEGIIDGARQLEQTAAAVAGLDGQLERKAQRLKTNPKAEQRPSTQARGVAEAVLRSIDPSLLALLPSAGCRGRSDGTAN